MKKTYSCRARGISGTTRATIGAFRFDHDEDGGTMALDVGAASIRKLFPNIKFTFLSVVPVSQKTPKRRPMTTEELGDALKNA